MRIAAFFLAAATTACLLAGCGEQPQTLPAARDAGWQSDSWRDQRRERTLHQGESRRIYG